MSQPEIDGVTVAIKSVNAHNNSDCEINTQVWRASRADKRKRNSYAGQEHKAHSYVNNNLRAYHKRRAEADQTARKIARHFADGNDFYNYESKYNQQSNIILCSLMFLVVLRIRDFCYF